MIIINRLMWIAIFISISSCCDVIDTLTDVMLGDGGDAMSAVILDVAMLSDMEIVVMDAPQITLEFVVGVAYAVDVPAGLLDAIIIDAVPVIDAVPAIDIGMFAGENVHGLVAVMTPAEFTLLPP